MGLQISQHSSKLMRPRFFPLINTSTQIQKILEKLPVSLGFTVIFVGFPHVFPWGAPKGPPGRLQEIDLTEEYASKDGQGNLAKCRAAAWETYGIQSRAASRFRTYTQLYPFFWNIDNMDIYKIWNNKTYKDFLGISISKNINNMEIIIRYLRFFWISMGISMSLRM